VVQSFTEQVLLISVFKNCLVMEYNQMTFIMCVVINLINMPRKKDPRSLWFSSHLFKEAKIMIPWSSGFSCSTSSSKDKPPPQNYLPQRPSCLSVNAAATQKSHKTFLDYIQMAMWRLFPPAVDSCQCNQPTAWKQLNNKKDVYYIQVVIYVAVYFYYRL
jgi:hypothetical protein